MFAKIKRFIARIKTPTHTVVHVEKSRERTSSPKRVLDNKTMMTAVQVLYYRLIDDYTVVLQQSDLLLGPPSTLEFDTIDEYLDECERLMELIQRTKNHNTNKHYVKRFNKLALKSGHVELALQE